MYIRTVAQSKSALTLQSLCKAISDISLRHFHGFHSALDMRTSVPKPYIAYYPALWDQSALRKTAYFINASGRTVSSHEAGHPVAYEPLATRESYDTKSPATFDGSKLTVRLGDIALARSGDKGSNLNVGVYVRTATQWEWLRTFFVFRKNPEPAR